MELPVVDFDVLALIIACLDTRSALRLAATHKAIHPVAVRQALRRVTLRRLSQIEGFSSFVLSRPANKAWLAQSELYILARWHWAYENVDEDAVHEALCNLFEQAPRLRHLSLAFFHEIFEMFGSRLARAIGALDNLNTLQLLDASIAAYRSVFPITSCRLQNLAISLPETDSAFYDELFTSLLPMQDLEELTLMDLHCDSDIYALSLCKWQKVRHLSLLSCTTVFPGYISAFPNVQSFRFTDTELYKNDNVRPYDTSDPQWPSLEHLRVGTCCEGYNGFICRVKRLEFDVVRSSHDPTLVSAITLIDNVKPSILTIPIHAPQALSFLDRLVRIGSTLRYVEVELDEIFSRFDIDQMLLFLSKLQLVCIRFYMNPFLGTHVYAGAIDQPLLESLPTRLMQEMTSLRYIACRGHRLIPEMHSHTSHCIMDFEKPLCAYLPVQKLVRRCDEEHDWWRVVGTGPDRFLRSIPLEVGERVRRTLHGMTYEGLQTLDAYSVF